MAEKPLVQKLLMKAGKSVLIINAPEGYLTALGTLPDKATLRTDPNGESADVIQLFVRNKAELDATAAAAFAAFKDGSVLWICYPKKSGKIKTDITRDHGWEAVKERDFHGVTQLSIDDTWSALRFRPRAEIAVMTRKF
jgi:hypothetical protein